MIRRTSLFAGIYAWMSAFFFGLICMDVVYAHSLVNLSVPTITIHIFSQVSDKLQVIGFCLVISALAALISSWNLIPVRTFLLISFSLFIVEMALPIIFPALKTSEGPFVIRLALNGTASLLAFIGFYFTFAHK